MITNERGTKELRRGMIQYTRVQKIQQPARVLTPSLDPREVLTGGITMEVVVLREGLGKILQR